MPRVCNLPVLARVLVCQIVSGVTGTPYPTRQMRDVWYAISYTKHSSPQSNKLSQHLYHLSSLNLANLPNLAKMFSFYTKYLKMI